MDDTVPIARNQRIAVRRKGRPLEERTRAGKRGNLLTGSKVPKLNRFAPIAACRQTLSIREEGHGVVAKENSMELSSPRACGYIPEFDDAVFARRGKELTIR